MIKLKEILESFIPFSPKQKNVIQIGRSPSGTIILNFDENKIKEGRSPSGNIVLTIDGNLIREGRSPSGNILATVIDNFVRLGRGPTGKVIANIDSANRIREGRSPSGNIVATTDGNGYYHFSLKTKRNRSYYVTTEDINYGAQPLNATKVNKVDIYLTK